MISFCSVLLLLFLPTRTSRRETIDIVHNEINTLSLDIRWRSSVCIVPPLFIVCQSWQYYTAILLSWGIAYRTSVRLFYLSLFIASMHGAFNSQCCCACSRESPVAIEPLDTSPFALHLRFIYLMFDRGSIAFTSASEAIVTGFKLF